MGQPRTEEGLKRLLNRYRKLPVVLIQFGLVVVSYWGSFALRMDLDVTNVPSDVVIKTLPLLIAVRMGSLGLFRLYQGMWRYVSVIDLVQIAKATTVSSALFVALEIPIFGLEGLPRSVFLLDWIGNIFLLGGMRLLVRVLRERFHPMAGGDCISKRLLIVGAGDAGASLCRQALASPTLRYKPVAFVERRSRQGREHNPGYTCGWTMQGYFSGYWRVQDRKRGNRHPIRHCLSDEPVPEVEIADRGSR